MLEGWAAERIFGDQRCPGLLLVTNWRAIFVDERRRTAAFPIPKINVVRSTGSTQMTLSVWYGSMQLAFDNDAAARAVETHLRQDPGRRTALLARLVVRQGGRS